MNIIQRLNIFMESTGLTVSQFADKLAVPRPSMSQLLNGRNKKVSNEIIEKLHAVFPALNVSWLLFGEGDMENAANTQFSSPQKTLNFADVESQSPAEQPITNSGVPNCDSTGSTSSTKFGQQGTIFPENPTLSTPKSSQNAAAPSNVTVPPSSADVTSAPVTTSSVEESEKNVTAKSSTTYPANVEEKIAGDFAKEYESPAPYGKSTPAASRMPDEEYRVSVLCSSPAAETARNSDKRISSIMVFYSDSSFEIFKPENGIQS